MKKIYSKDECAPDAPGALSWLCNSDIGKGLKVDDPSISLVNEDYMQWFYVGQNKIYMIQCSCGVFEDVYELSLDEMHECINTVWEAFKTAVESSR